METTLPQSVESVVDIIKPIDYKIKLLKNGDINTLRVDSGDHYYEGKVDLTKFPKELNEPLNIVEKSLTNYDTPNIKIKGTFTPISQTTTKSTYTIKFICIQEFFTTEKEIVIDMTHYKKKEIDYINERFNEMTTEINTLKFANTELRSLVDRMETKILELQFNGDDAESYESEVKVTKKPEPVQQTTTQSKGRKSRDYA
jgi:hypothetical protein